MARYLSYDEATDSYNGAWQWLFYYFYERLLNEDPDWQMPEEFNSADKDDEREMHFDDLHEFVLNGLDHVLEAILNGDSNWVIPRRDVEQFGKAMRQYERAVTYMRVNDPDRHRYQVEPAF